jgi:hypothetical protein
LYTVAGKIFCMKYSARKEPEFFYAE